MEPPPPAGKVRLPLTAREREILLATGIENLDLARRVRLPPLVDGWVTAALTREEFDRLTWIVCQIDDCELYSELLPLRRRIRRILTGEPALPDPEPGPPSPEPSAITVQFSDRERLCLERNRELLEDLPPDVRDALTAEVSQGVELLFGEAALLLDRLDEVAMAEETPDLVAHDMISVCWRIRKAVDRHEAYEDGQCWRIWLTLDQIERLLAEVLVVQEEERVRRLELRLYDVQHHFHWSPPPGNPPPEPPGR